MRDRWFRYNRLNGRQYTRWFREIRLNRRQYIAGLDITDWMKTVKTRNGANVAGIMFPLTDHIILCDFPLFSIDAVKVFISAKGVSSSFKHFSTFGQQSAMSWTRQLSNCWSLVAWTSPTQFRSAYHHPTSNDYNGDYNGSRTDWLIWMPICRLAHQSQQRRRNFTGYQSSIGLTTKSSPWHVILNNCIRMQVRRTVTTQKG